MKSNLIFNRNPKQYFYLYLYHYHYLYPYQLNHRERRVKRGTRERLMAKLYKLFRRISGGNVIHIIHQLPLGRLQASARGKSILVTKINYSKILFMVSGLWCPETRSKGLRVENNEGFLFVVGNAANCSLSLFVFSVCMVGHKGNSKGAWGGHTPGGSRYLCNLTEENRIRLL